MNIHWTNHTLGSFNRDKQVACLALQDKINMQFKSFFKELKIISAIVFIFDIYVLLYISYYILYIYMLYIIYYFFMMSNA